MTNCPTASLTWEKPTGSDSSLCRTPFEGSTHTCRPNRNDAMLTSQKLKSTSFHLRVLPCLLRVSILVDVAGRLLSRHIMFMQFCAIIKSWTVVFLVNVTCILSGLRLKENVQKSIRIHSITSKCVVSRKEILKINAQIGFKG